MLTTDLALIGSRIQPGKRDQDELWIKTYLSADDNKQAYRDGTCVIGNTALANCSADNLESEDSCMERTILQ